MRSLGVPEFMLSFFHIMDTNSHLRFKTSKTNLTPGIKPTCGTLQGDPASGTRFNSIMFLLMFRLRAAKIGWLSATGDLIYGHCYADDTVLFAENHADLQQLADIVSEFCESLNIGINADKTIYVTTDTTAPDIEIYNWKTRSKTTCKRKGPNDPVRYLGVHLTMTLNWKTSINKIEHTIRDLARNIVHSPLNYPQALRAANMVIGGYTNFHFQFVPIPPSTLQKWDNTILSALSKKTGCPENIAHIHHVLPNLCGKHHFRLLSSLYPAIQISETMIRLNDDGSLINRLARKQLQDLTKTRCAQYCAFSQPTRQAGSRRCLTGT